MKPVAAQPRIGRSRTRPSSRWNRRTIIGGAYTSGPRPRTWLAVSGAPIDGVRAGHRPGSARAAAHAHEDLLRVRGALRRAAELLDVPGLPRDARGAPRPQPPGRR